MRFASRAILGLTLMIVGCGTPDSANDADTTWAGTVTTEGNVTTVVNESGSVWGGTATLVEELSIGVDAGEDPYMFGQVTGLWVTDVAIFVVDSQAPAVRVFDPEGRHLRDIGAVGQGPGEFQRPGRIAVDDSGRVFVKDSRDTRVILYSPEGEYIDTWGFPSTIRAGAAAMVVTRDGVPYIQHIDAPERLPDGRPNPDSTRRGMQAVGPDGKVGALSERPSFPPTGNLTYTTETGEYFSSVPFLAFGTSAMARSGAWISGFGADYKFTVEYPDGTKTVVERNWDPVPILPNERDAYEAHRTSRIRSQLPGWDWNGPPIPDYKPAFWRFYPGQEGRILITRLGPGMRSEDDDCIEFPTPQDFIEAQEQRRSIVGCWTDSRIWDVFSEEGKFLGELDVSQVRRTALSLRGETLLTAEEDEAGVIRVKKYRIVPPRDGQ